MLSVLVAQSKFCFGWKVELMMTKMPSIESGVDSYVITHEVFTPTHSGQQRFLIANQAHPGILYLAMSETLLAQNPFLLVPPVESFGTN